MRPSGRYSACWALWAAAAAAAAAAEASSTLVGDVPLRSSLSSPKSSCSCTVSTVPVQGGSIATWSMNRHRPHFGDRRRRQQRGSPLPPPLPQTSPLTSPMNLPLMWSCGMVISPLLAASISCLRRGCSERSTCARERVGVREKKGDGAGRRGAAPNWQLPSSRVCGHAPPRTRPSWRLKCASGWRCRCASSAWWDTKWSIESRRGPWQLWSGLGRRLVGELFKSQIF